MDADVLRAALFAAAGETQAVVNQFGLASRAGPGSKVAADGDFRAALRRALQMGRAEAVSMQTGLGGHGVLAEPCDVVVAGRTRTPQLAIQIAWHPRGEDHGGFVLDAMRALLKMSLARAHQSAEQCAVVLAAPARFWRWLPGYAAEQAGLDVLDPDPETPASVTLEFLAGSGVGPAVPLGSRRRVAGPAVVRGDRVGAGGVAVGRHRDAPARGEGPGRGQAGPLVPEKDYSGTPLPKKLGIKEGSRVAIVDAPEGFAATLTPMPGGVEVRRR